jgi:hypothetical protein
MAPYVKVCVELRREWLSPVTDCVVKTLKFVLLRNDVKDDEWWMAMASLTSKVNLKVSG